MFCCTVVCVLSKADYCTTVRVDQELIESSKDSWHDGSLVKKQLLIVALMVTQLLIRFIFVDQLLTLVNS